MRKIAIVVQRFGEDIMGGAERHAFILAKNLSKYFDVTVLSTCAKDYYSWKNEYSASESFVHSVRLIRFKTDFERNKKRFDKISSDVFDSNDQELNEVWMKEQGPFSSDLFEYLKDNDGKFEAFIFFTYLYASTVLGFREITKSKKILIPTAHDEKPIYLSIFQDVFKNADAIIYNTEQEKSFVNDLFQNNDVKSLVAGIFVEIPDDFKNLENSNSNFFTYIGRIDENKGLNELFEFYSSQKIKKPLVLAGKKYLDIPKNISYKGVISENEKFNLICSSDFIIIPSKFESLSMLLLESFLCSKPVLVNGNCQVLKEHCLRSNGGLWYDDDKMFFDAIDWFENNKELAVGMGKNGKKYFDENYSKEIVMNKILDFINEII